jgi:hypothetical protein
MTQFYNRMAKDLRPNKYVTFKFRKSSNFIIN